MPEKPGVYLFLDRNKSVLYVGKAKNLRNRVASYFTKNADLGEKTRALVEKIHGIKTLEALSEIESLLLEASIVKKYNPAYNIRLRDDKSYPLIRVTAKLAIPAVLIARRADDASSVYFGPFPSASTVRLVLRTIRRIFPYQSTINHAKRMCLYHHLGLCPCVSAHPTTDAKKQYKKTVSRILSFLDGNISFVLKDLERERNNHSKEQAFEKAAKLQKQINAIILITQPIHTPFEYETNPNLRDDLTNSALEDLQTVLRSKGIQVNTLHRIECYDISNIQGTNPTASLVVFTDGEKTTKYYRRFKIKSLAHHHPDDFAAIKEVLQRRMGHKEWPLADLIIVDGGKGQVSAAKQILDELSVDIPIIGLAKREETIVTPEMHEISLSKRSPALLLLMRIRDEAHRFAVAYHKKLRSTSLLTNS